MDLPDANDASNVYLKIRDEMKQHDEQERLAALQPPPEPETPREPTPGQQQLQQSAEQLTQQIQSNQADPNLIQEQQALAEQNQEQQIELQALQQIENIPEETNEDPNVVNVEAGTILFRILNTNEKSPTNSLNSVVHPETEEQGNYFYRTIVFPEGMALEKWKDIVLNKYLVKEDISVKRQYVNRNMRSLYDEVANGEDTAQLFITEDQYENLMWLDQYELPLMYIRDRYKIKKRRFVMLPKNTMLYSADDEIIETPDSDGLRFFYITKVLPEDSVLTEWRDKILNVYVLNEDMILPYGADDERDPYFQEIYQGELTSYYDDTVVGKYLQNKPETAEVALVPQDLGNISYYGSFELKLDLIKFIYGIEKPLMS